MKALSCLVGLLLVLGVPTRAFGLAGELMEPGLAFPAGFPEAARAPLMAALRLPDATFLGGRFVNWFTTLRYGGETPALNQFLEGLAKCPGVVLAVRFQRERVPEGCDWWVSHEAGEPGRVAVHVNLNSTRIRLESLVMPEAKGPPLPEAPGLGVSPHY